MKLLLSACLSAMTLAACASAPVPREAAGAYAEGYTEHSLSANRYLVEYRMEGADYQRAYDLALWRAAQIALEKGYPTFEVVNRNTTTDAGARASTTFTTERSVASPRCGLLGCSRPAVPMEWTSLEMSHDGRRALRVVSLEILLTPGRPNGSANLYDAAEVLKAVSTHARG